MAVRPSSVNHTLMPFHVSIHSMFDDWCWRSSARRRVSASGTARGRRLEYSSPMTVTTTAISHTAPIELTNTCAAVESGSMLPLEVNTSRHRNSVIMSAAVALGTNSSASTANPTAV